MNKPYMNIGILKRGEMADIIQTAVSKCLFVQRIFLFETISGFFTFDTGIDIGIFFVMHEAFKELQKNIGSAASLKYPTRFILIGDFGVKMRPFLRDAMKYGAVGFLTPGCDEEEIIRAIHKIFAGQKYFSEDLREQLTNAYLNKSLPFPLLSPQELAFIKYACEGNTLKETAMLMRITEKQATYLRRTLFKKTGMKNTGTLIQYALVNGLVTLSIKDGREDF